eukprot:symbB.v1.2.006801.t2/scaffold409.1/size210228/4
MDSASVAHDWLMLVEQAPVEALSLLLRALSLLEKALKVSLDDERMGEPLKRDFTRTFAAAEKVERQLQAAQLSCAEQFCAVAQPNRAIFESAVQHAKDAAVVLSKGQEARHWHLVTVDGELPMTSHDRWMRVIPFHTAMAAMISPVSISPHRYQPADDLEIPSNGDHESSEGSDSMSSDTPPEVDKAETSGYIHPDDSMHQHWYETTTRLRCVFYVFFSLAVMVSIAMGATTEIFFSLMATPPDEGLSVGVVVAVVFVPIFLLCTAVYVDECVDVGLDAADRPCFGLWRATITTAGRAISPKIHTDHRRGAAAAAGNSAAMLTARELRLIAETFAIGGCYILISASLIAFNKYLMNADRFPYAKAMTAMHMAMTTFMSLLLYTCAPSLYPSMGKAKENWRTLLKYILPLGFLFALALYCSNRAYLYSSVAFLQFCKEGNVALIFAMSCLLGLQVFSWHKVAILSIVVAGCSLCAHGEVNFVWAGFVLQITSQMAECSKNLIGEMVMSGAGLKLDVLTFVLFQAPCSLLPLLISVALSWDLEIWFAFKAHWPVIFLNALNAFALNLIIATTLKRLSAVAFVIIGIVKDSVIVATSSLVFGDHISAQQQVGFAVIMTGIACWSHLKIKEQQESDKLKESEPLTAGRDVPATREKLLIFLIEGIPIIFAVITISLSTSLTYWYKDLFRGYCLGGLIFALLVCGSYVLCHIFVGHNPHRDDMMACTYHNMRPLGVFKRVVKKPLDTGEERQPHWGRCVMYFFSGLVIEGIVLGIFVIFHNFHCVFIGQMIATILWAMAVRNYAPRLLGKAFWFTFVFFIILTVGLLVGTLAQTKAGPEIQEANNDRLKPLAYGPDAKEYGKTDQDFNGLPLHFELSPWAPGPGYPVCKAYWGFPGYSQVNSLGILDLAVLAFSSSMWDEAAIRRGLGNMLNGTVLEDFELLEVEDPRTVGRWIVISFPKLKLRVLSVRGTSSVQDAYADLKLYSSVAVLQFMAILTPVLSLMPVAVTRRLVKSELGNALFGNKDIWKRLEVAAAEHKKAAREKGEILILTGHSLGGALVGAVSSRVAVDGIGFSPPGLYYQVLKYHIKLKELYDSFTIIQPSNDVVPRVDRQRGMIEWIDCDENPATCHRLTHTACELWVKCGDERKRDWRSVCSEWYSRSDVNLATDVS